MVIQIFTFRLNPFRVCFLLLVAVLAGCRPGSVSKGLSYTSLEGRTMGTYYAITYADSIDRSFTNALDSLLVALNEEVSTYVEDATISAFNQSGSGISLNYNPFGTDEVHENKHLRANFAAARRIFEQTGGAFDPTVMPLVNYWGFGYTEKRKVTQVDSVKIDSLMGFIGMDEVQIKGDSLIKTRAGVQLDFSAIAKGYGVDQLAGFLRAQGIKNYFIDIGGEVIAAGKSPRGDAWRIGISNPTEGAAVDDLQFVVPLENQAIATSGNYRNFYEVAGVKYSHTINPTTGFPERSRLLSASVFAPDCMTADAYATACMVAGVEKALAFAENNDHIEVYLIIATDTGEMDVAYSEGLKTIFDNNQ